MRSVAFVLAMAGCGTSYEDVVGPFTGQTYRFTLDAIQLPSTNTSARDHAGDLDGNGQLDNQLGNVLRTLQGIGDITEHGADMIAAGIVPTSIEITADDLMNDRTVGVRYLGTLDARYVVIGGSFEQGAFRSNPTAHSAVPGEAELLLPVFTDADPSQLYAIGVELTLEPDGDGGFDAEVHAAIPTNVDFVETVRRGLDQMITSDPGGHRGMMLFLDTSRDGVLSYDEIANNSLLVSLLSPDVMIGDTRALSLGFRAHFRACESGPCLDALPVDHCFDRVLDGDETDLDCGGSCRPCEAEAMCVAISDCETQTCDQGHCGPPSCTDGIRDGLESGVDCGGGCPGCPIGAECYLGSDCASGQCGEPCTDDSGFGCWDFDFVGDVCYPPG